MNKRPSNSMIKSDVDEETFQKILSASYVMQEHNQEPSPVEGTLSSGQILSEVIAAQQQIQSGRLSLAEVKALVAQRTQKLTQADEVAVGLIEDEFVSYQTYIRGSGAVLSRVPVSECLSANCLRNAQVMRYSDAGSNFAAHLVRSGSSGEGEVSSQNARAFLAVPILHLEKVAGVVELRFEQPQTVPDRDLHTCQLMAGLVGDAITRCAESQLKQALSLERAAMLQVLEQLKPQLARLTAEPPANFAAPSAPSSATDSELRAGEETSPGVSFEGLGSGKAVETQEPPKMTSAPRQVEPSRSQHDLDGQLQELLQSAGPSPVDESCLCRGCGLALQPDEFFCGKCGTARLEVSKGSRDIQSKWASLWYMQQASEKQARNGSQASHPTPSSIEDSDNFISGLAEKANGEPAEIEPPAFSLVSFPAEVSQRGGLHVQDQPYGDPAVENRTLSTNDSIGEQRKVEPNQLSLEVHPISAAHSLPTVGKSPWGSAATTRAWLESLETEGRFRVWVRRQWKNHRANFYLAAALLLVLIAISGWGTRSLSDGAAPGPGQATGRLKKAAAPQLSTFEKVLVGLNLAEAPPVPVYLGNPAKQVWVDLQTALYYCPGADLYGKTAKGKYTSQRDAQQDQFEPAYRKACN